MKIRNLTKAQKSFVLAVCATLDIEPTYEGVTVLCLDRRDVDTILNADEYDPQGFKANTATIAMAKMNLAKRDESCLAGEALKDVVANVDNLAQALTEIIPTPTHRDVNKTDVPLSRALLLSPKNNAQVVSILSGEDTEGHLLVRLLRSLRDTHMLAFGALGALHGQILTATITQVNINNDAGYYITAFDRLARTIADEVNACLDTWYQDNKEEFTEMRYNEAVRFETSTNVDENTRDWKEQQTLIYAYMESTWWYMGDDISVESARDALSSITNNYVNAYEHYYDMFYEEIEAPKERQDTTQSYLEDAADDGTLTRAGMIEILASCGFTVESWDNTVADGLGYDYTHVLLFLSDANAMEE